MKQGMLMRSMFPDFDTVKEDVHIHGCSLWVKPYDPTPLIVFNPSHSECAKGEIIKAPNVERLADYILLTAPLYPYSQQMRLECEDIEGTPIVQFFHSQHTQPDLNSEFSKIEDGEFTHEIHSGLWNDAITDTIWLE